jgi:hypothetical protein
MRLPGLSVILLAALAAALPGCLAPRLAPAGNDQTPVFRGAVGPFAPASLRLHPLTHLERAPDGAVYLLAHIQLRDRWSDICKGVGMVQFSLYMPTGLGGAGQEEQVRRWDIDLYPLDRNAVFFDPATQTYRFSLGDLPDWAQQMAPGGDKDAVGPGRFRIIARLTTPTPEGGQTALVDELELGR